MTQRYYDSIENQIRVAKLLRDMDDPDVKLPSPEELANWFRETRREHGITQTALADRAGISPSQISRVESRSGDASYETMYRIQRELLSIIERQSGVTRSAGDIVQEKHQRYGDEYGLVGVEPSARVEDVVTKMASLNVFQLPVITDKGESVGRITERDLIEEDCRNRDRIKTHMRSPFPEVGADTPATIVRDLLQTNEAVLVTNDGREDLSITVNLVTPGDTANGSITDHHYAGILTRADFTLEMQADR